MWKKRERDGLEADMEENNRLKSVNIGIDELTQLMLFYEFRKIS